ncbi:uncharacterized protein DUF4230 [Dyadobacter jejuensis]|uniref:Uncharacterized protein DUF4230 n=1 Tax=Dyadobacter jejuensis TaxID=1082580 RepID=A0A316BA38_9BACT|nr:DUF4230 domain-containing protein [Dyadobacter jejuensis]PWJ59407.1 uncharacterized protein DUF4230 [Dyadobacter jejuensis]
MRIINWIVRLIVFAFLILGVKSAYNLVSHGGGIPSWWAGEDKEETAHHVLLQEITAMGKLELVKYNFKDVVEQQIVKTWLPNAKAILIVQGEAIGCIDLTQVQIADISSQDEVLVVNMPDPELCVFKIDHSKSKIYNLEYAFMEESKLIDGAYRQAEKQIQTSALDMGILDQTRENARKILIPMLEKASGRKVVLKFPLHAQVDKLR